VQAVVLHSGGMDSTTMLAMAIKEHKLEPSEIMCLSILYGQKHHRELEAAKAVADYYGCESHVIELNHDLFTGGGSAIIGEGEVDMPHLTYKEIAEGEGVSPTYVPFRNGNLLSAATAIALVGGADSVYFGAHAEDARGWAYPDCTPEFIGAMANAIYVGSYHKVRLLTPLEWMMKSDIARKGLDLDVPFELTWSCYEGGQFACGECPTCIERIEAFKVNAAEDPVEYAVAVDWDS